MHKIDCKKTKQTTTQRICLRQYSTQTGVEIHQCATGSEQERKVKTHSLEDTG